MLSEQENARTPGCRRDADPCSPFATLVFALAREDVLMIALGLLLAATSMQVLRHQ